MMNQKEQLISEINALRDKIGHFKIYLNKDTNEQLSIGYYFDKEKKLWTSYYINDFKIKSNTSEDEIEILKHIYKTVCKTAELYENPILKIKEIIPHLRSVSIYLNDYCTSPYAIGYYYDKQKNAWLVYRNGERSDTGIYGTYEYEIDAIASVYSMARREYSFQHN